MKGLFKTEGATIKKRHRNNVRISFDNADKAKLLHIFKKYQNITLLELIQLLTVILSKKFFKIQ